MVGSVERIAQEIATLDQKVETIAQELHSAYADYLTALGQAVRQQLILASYHVCTQGYPEAFLSLDYPARHTLQKHLRYLSRQVQEQLQSQLHVPLPIEESEPEELGLDELERLMNPPTTPTIVDSTPPRSLTPSDLVQWQRGLEQAIDGELQTASHAANHLLQQAGILSKQLPQGLLEAATKADMADGSGGNTPNVLSLRLDAMEMDSEPSQPEDISKPSIVLHVIAIHLRLSEVEFTDTPTTALRTRLRTLGAQLKTLGREYGQKQRERAIAEAQAAWRSSWSEE